MSADSFHATVERAMGSKKLYDFQDFIDVIGETQTHVKPEVMNFNDFYDWKDVISRHFVKGKLLVTSIKVLQVRRGSLSLFVKKKS